MHHCMVLLQNSISFIQILSGDDAEEESILQGSVGNHISLNEVKRCGACRAFVLRKKNHPHMSARAYPREHQCLWREINFTCLKLLILALCEQKHLNYQTSNNYLSHVFKVQSSLSLTTKVELFSSRFNIVGELREWSAGTMVVHTSYLTSAV